MARLSRAFLCLLKINNTIGIDLINIFGIISPIPTKRETPMQSNQHALAEKLIEAVRPLLVDQPQPAIHTATQPITLPPRMVKIGENGEHLPDDAEGHVAVLLPDFGLMFDAREPHLANSWSDAKDHAKSIDLLGCDDWFLPESFQLQLLINHSQAEPAIDTNFFPHTPTKYRYWTATEYKSVSSFAWLVSFLLGSVYYGSQGSSGFVRACRRVAPGQF